MHKRPSAKEFGKMVGATTYCTKFRATLRENAFHKDEGAIPGTVTESVPCWSKHYGLCETDDADVFVRVTDVHKELATFAQGYRMMATSLGIERPTPRQVPFPFFFSKAKTQNS